MKLLAFTSASIALAAFLAGCSTKAPQASVAPAGTVPYDILITANGSGARVTVNGEDMGNTPLHLKVYGDRDGSFHDYGSYSFLVSAHPLTSDQFVQTRVFATNRNTAGGDAIPQAIQFDMYHSPTGR